MTTNKLTDERLATILYETQATIMKHNSRQVRGSVEVDAQLFEEMLMEIQLHRKAWPQWTPVERTDLRAMVLSEIGDFFAGFGGPGEMETPEKMLQDLSMRVGQILNDHIVNYPRCEALVEILKECRIARDAAQSELQEYRKAASQPIGWTDEQELRSVDKDGCGYLFKANPVSPHADPRRVVMVYAGPKLVNVAENEG